MKKRRACFRMLLLSILMLMAMAVPVSAKTSVAAPASFRVQSQGDLNATLRWSKRTGLSGYALYQYDTTTKTYKLVKRLSGSSYTCLVSKLTEGQKYRYRLKAYKKVNGKIVYSSGSDIEFTAKAMSEDIKSIRRPRYTVKTKKKVTVTDKKTKKKVTLAKGTSLTVTAKSGKTVNGYLKNGHPITIKRSYLKYTGLDSSSKKDYSKSLKEAFVNQKMYASSTNWLIWVSESTYKVNVYKGSKGKWKLQASFSCCIGKWNTRTSSGVKRILGYGSPKYGGPVILFSVGDGTPEVPEGCAFHRVLDSNINKAVSNGCVRLRMDGLLYIYQNCKIGTRVIVY